MTLTYSSGASRTLGNLRMTPGRWVALAFALPVAIALIGWTAFDFVGLVANGSYPFSYPVPVQGRQVTVNLNGSNITLRQAQGGTARLTGVVQYGLFRPGLAESTEGGAVTVGLSCDGIASNCGMNATLGVPTGTAVSLETGGGDLQTTSFSGHLTVSTDGGNVNAGNLGGTLAIATGGGDLTGNALTGIIQASTDGGNINAADLTGVLRLDTGGGDLTSDVMAGGDVQIYTEGGNVNANSVASPQATVQSGGGDVTLVFTQPPTDLQITADGGNVTLVLPHGDTRYDFMMQPGGGNLSYPSSLASSTSRNTITVDSGGGDITITEAN